MLAWKPVVDLHCKLYKAYIGYLFGADKSNFLVWLSLSWKLWSGLYVPIEISTEICNFGITCQRSHGSYILKAINKKYSLHNIASKITCKFDMHAYSWWSVRATKKNSKRQVNCAGGSTAIATKSTAAGKKILTKSKQSEATSRRAALFIEIQKKS